MMLRYVVPVEFEVYGEGLDEGALTSAFAFKRLNVDVRLASGEKPYTMDIDGRSVQTLTIDHLSISIDDRSDNSLTNLVRSSQWDTVLKTLLRVANGCISQIRDTGGVPHVHTITKSGREDARFVLHNFDVQVSEDGTTWRDIIEKSELYPDARRYLVQLMVSKPKGWLSLSRWASVKSSLASGVDPDVAAQCTVNAQEYLELGNLRLAVLESVMGLELSVASYLSEYGKRKLHMSKDQIETMLAPTVTLEIRLKCLLPFCQGDRALPDDSLKKVVTVVKWRNAIVHKLGGLPAGTSPDVAASYIQEVILVVEWFRFQVRNMETASPPITQRQP
jgi:hypothetical protein